MGSSDCYRADTIKAKLNYSRDLNPLGSDIGCNFYVKACPMRFSGNQMGRTKLDTIFKKLKSESKTQFGLLTSEPPCPIHYGAETLQRSAKAALTCSDMLYFKRLTTFEENAVREEILMLSRSARKGLG